MVIRIRTCFGGDPARGRFLVAVLSVTLAVVTGCKNAEPRDGAAPTSSRVEHGSHMTPPRLSVSQVRRSGPGPKVGDHWRAWVAINVCGQFLEPPEGSEFRGVTARPDGSVTIEPGNAAEAGHWAVVGSFMQSVGATLSSGRLTLPASIVPPEITVRGEKVAVAGQTFTDGQDCGGVVGKVAVWVYSPEAVRTGNGLVTVVDDPEEVPFFADGMAVVVTFTPESSLPTLPPAAAVGGTGSGS